MTPEAFRATLSEPQPPAGLSLPAQALWWEARGDWDRAHECAQAGEDAASCAVHAYLHRREGDVGNAAYWYRRAGRAVARGDLGEEWSLLVRELLGG